jgi:membrane-bound lytic murein transglycosylase A
MQHPVAYEAVTFAALPGWKADRISDALPALRSSCTRFAAKAPEEIIGADVIGRPAGAWQRACAEITAATTEDDLRQRLMRLFVPYVVAVRVSRTVSTEGKFTGYYEADLKGSLTRHGPYQTPIYGVPKDLVTVDLQQFMPEDPPLALPKKLVGHVDTTPAGNALVPYFTREQIDRDQVLAGRADVIAWSDDPVDVHILHIQGSGRITLDDGQVLHLGFAGHNGRAFRGIGSILLAAGVLQRGDANMDRVRSWLRDHPDDAKRYMDENARYIFFRLNPVPGDATDQEGPIGSLGVPLTPNRSLAVDPRFIPLGAFLWLDTTAPDGAPIRRLVAAQDTGAAITGAVRGDLFWGHGPDAFAQAARMNSAGRYYVLVPAS